MKLWKRIGALVEESAAQWQVSSRVAWRIFWLPIVGAVLMAAVWVRRDLFEFLLGEDGPVEWVQFACFVAAAVIGAGVARECRAKGLRGTAMLYAGFAMAMVFIAGEEISWGQRLLGVETPAALAAINKQGETTIHNIGTTLKYYNAGMMLVGAYGSVMFLVNRKLRLERRFERFDTLFVPPAFLAPGFLLVFLWRFLRFTLLPMTAYTLTTYGEWIEFCLAFGLCAFTWLNYRLLAAPAPQTAPAKSTAVGAVIDT